MILQIDPHSAIAPFEQLRAQFAAAIASGELAAATRLPTVRRLAGDLGLAPNTVARAYRALESDELIETRGRLGSFVARRGDARQRGAHMAAQQYLERLSELGVTPEEALEYVRSALPRTAPETPPLT